MLLLTIETLKQTPSINIERLAEPFAKDAEAKLNYSVPTLRVKLPPIVNGGQVKTKRNPGSKREDLYFVEGSV